MMQLSKPGYGGLLSNKQQGLALIAVLMLFVFVVLLAVAMVERQELTMKRAGNAIQREELRQVALGVEINLKEMTLALLENAKKLGQKDKYFYLNPLGFFASPLPEVEDYDVVIHISDPRGRLNLNELSQEADATRRAALEVILRKLLSNLSFEDPSAFIQEAKRWVDSDLMVSDSEYENRDIPHKAGHQTFKDFSELRVFEWLTEKDREQKRLDWLSLYVDVYPLKGAQDKLNINTSCRKLLNSLFDGCPQCVTDILKERDSGIEEVATGFMGKGFKKPDDFSTIQSVEDFLKQQNNQNNPNAPPNISPNTSNTATLWPATAYGVMTDYLDIYIRVQRKGTVDAFDMKTRFYIDESIPSVDVVSRNYSPLQPLTLVNQRICID